MQQRRSHHFPDRKPTCEEVVEIVVRVKNGDSLSLTETARVMYGTGRFDRVPDKHTILDLQRSAMAKLRRALQP